jgi:SAM-dependent methyltransferase
MEDFLTIFAPLTYHGPATPEDTVAAWRLVRGPTSSVLDLGCGPGNATLLLAQQPDVHVHALDGLEQSLDKLKARAEEAGLASKITLVHGDMAEPPFKPGTLRRRLVGEQRLCARVRTRAQGVGAAC